MSAKKALALPLALLWALLLVTPALGSTKIGQVAPADPVATCQEGPYDLIEPTVTGGPSYVVPPKGAAVTSWSTTAAAAGGQLEFKVFRKVAEPSTYQVVAHDGPHTLVPSQLNTFAVNIAVQPDDVIGLNDTAATTTTSPVACYFADPPNGYSYLFGDIADGATGVINNPDPGRSLNVAATVALRTSNNFDFGSVIRNKQKGTATLSVDVPGPGTIALTGQGLKTQRPGAGAAASRTVTDKGTVKLLVKAKGKKKRKLNRKGHVKVKANVTFTPNGTSTGDLAGSPKTDTKPIKLVKTG
jgi:hypothetical protein